MKKLIVIIIILATIFVGMIIYKNVAIKINNNINIKEIEEIETYITKIYMWKEVTGDALPYFKDINQANDMWIWEVVKKNLEDYELNYEQIEEKAKEIFGNNFTKKFSREGTDYLVYNKENNKYYAVEMSLDEKEDSFLLNKIKKTKDGYDVEIIEYLEDYSELLENKQVIVIRNIKEEEIERINVNEEEKAKDIVKSNVDKFSKKKLKIKKDKNSNGNLFIESVEEVK